MINELSELVIGQLVVIIQMERAVCNVAKSMELLIVMIVECHSLQWFCARKEHYPVINTTDKYFVVEMAAILSSHKNQ